MEAEVKVKENCASQRPTLFANGMQTLANLSQIQYRKGNWISDAFCNISNIS